MKARKGAYDKKLKRERKGEKVDKEEEGQGEEKGKRQRRLLRSKEEFFKRMIHLWKKANQQELGYFVTLPGGG